MNKILFILFFLTPFISKSEEPVFTNVSHTVETTIKPSPILLKLISFKLRKKKNTSEENRLTAAGLALVLGPFGVHRLYLGTSTKVPAIYAITLGGFFVIPLVDMVVILTTKDFNRLKNDERVIMWPNRKEKSQTE